MYLDGHIFIVRLTASPHQHFVLLALCQSDFVLLRGLRLYTMFKNTSYAISKMCLYILIPMLCLPFTAFLAIRWISFAACICYTSVLSLCAYRFCSSLCDLISSLSITPLSDSSGGDVVCQHAICIAIRRCDLKKRTFDIAIFTALLERFITLYLCIIISLLVVTVMMVLHNLGIVRLDSVLVCLTANALVDIVFVALTFTFNEKIFSVLCGGLNALCCPNLQRRMVQLSELYISIIEEDELGDDAMDIRAELVTEMAVHGFIQNMIVDTESARGLRDNVIRVIQDYCAVCPKKEELEPGDISLPGLRTKCA